MINCLLLMNEVCRAFPQECSLVSALEYICGVAPPGPRSLTAVDLTQGYALASDKDWQLVPLIVLPGDSETDVAKKLLENFKELHSIFFRMIAHKARQKQDELNRKRSYRVCQRGETLVRRLPKCARPPKNSE